MSDTTAAAAPPHVHRPECRASQIVDDPSGLDQAEIAADTLASTINAVRLLNEQGLNAAAEVLRAEFPQMLATIAHGLGLDEHQAPAAALSGPQSHQI